MSLERKGNVEWRQVVHSALGVMAGCARLAMIDDSPKFVPYPPRRFGRFDQRSFSLLV